MFQCVLVTLLNSHTFSMKLYRSRREFGCYSCFGHAPPLCEVSWNLVMWFLRNTADRQTDRQANKQAALKAYLNLRIMRFDWRNDNKNYSVESKFASSCLDLHWVKRFHCVWRLKANVTFDFKLNYSRVTLHSRLKRL